MMASWHSVNALVSSDTFTSRRTELVLESDASYLFSYHLRSGVVMASVCLSVCIHVPVSLSVCMYVL